MPTEWKTNISRLTLLSVQVHGNSVASGRTCERKQGRLDQTGKSVMTRALVADRLRCMLEHIHTGNTDQVLLHSLAIANAVPPVSFNVEIIRDLVQEAQGLFLRGNIRSAEDRLLDALDYLGTNQTKGSILTFRTARVGQ